MATVPRSEVFEETVTLRPRNDLNIHSLQNYELTKIYRINDYVCRQSA